MISSVWHGDDGARQQVFGGAALPDPDLVLRRQPRSRCGAKGVLRHTSLSATSIVFGGPQPGRTLLGPISSPDHPEHRDVALLDLDVQHTKLARRPLRLARSDFSLHITTKHLPALCLCLLTTVIRRNPELA